MTSKQPRRYAFGEILIKLTNEDKPDIELVIQMNTSSDRDKLLELQNHKLLGNEVDLVYIYYLEENDVSYPNRNGKIIYIGEAGRKEKTGKRFSQHISSQENIGGDTGTNYTLSKYYWLGKRIVLRIFLLDTKNNSELRKSIERQLLQAHLKIFGALPIAQGASGSNYTVSKINEIQFSDAISDLINA